MYWHNSFLGTWAVPPGAEWLFALGGLVFFLAVAWSLFWKGVALWKAARKGNRVWFVVFLVVNTLGILEILYLYVFSKKSAAVGGVSQID